MFAVEPVAIGAVILWLLVTIAYQYPPFHATLGRIDVLRLLPSWSFFAPRPVTRDSHLVVREVLDDGTITAWRPMSCFPARRWVDAIWNPSKHSQKIIRDALRTIKLTRGRSSSADVVACSLPYLLVLHYCSTQSLSRSNAVARQFAIVETSGREGRRIWITFISAFHPF